MRTRWIDELRGFCMMAILWFHTEMYYAGTDITPYAFYVGDVLAAFFFLSGYLFCSKGAFSLRRKLQGIVRWLLVPYLVFTLPLAVPKALAHGETLSAGELLMPIVSGRASWFVAALIVSELLFALAISLTKDRRWLLGAIAAVMLVAACLLPDVQPLNESLLGFSLLCAGHLYRIHERPLEAWLTRPYIFLPLSALLIALKVLTANQHWQMLFSPLASDCYPVFILDLLLAALLLSTLFKHIPHHPIGCNLPTIFLWTGQHTLVYYFICGGVPLLVGKLLTALGIPYGGFLTLLPAFILVYVVATALVWITYRYTRIVKGNEGFL